MNRPENPPSRDPSREIVPISQLTQDADTIYARLSMDGEQCDVPSWGTDSHGVSHQDDVQLGLSTSC